MAGQSDFEIVRDHIYFTPSGPESWHTKPEFPSAEEILARESGRESLPENHVDTPWPSKEDYLKAQYEILRHEAVEGLRYSVATYAAQCRRSRRGVMEDNDTCIYTRVHVRKYLMCNLGAVCRVSFSTEKSHYQIPWLQSKRLLPGTVVALSPSTDNFQTICKIATVAQRRYKDALDQDPPLVDLLWVNPQDAVLDPDLEMVMIESRNGYYEAARHSLVGLQHAARCDSPLDKYLIGACKNDGFPEFMAGNTFMDLSSLVHRPPEEESTIIDDLRTYDISRGQPNLGDITSLDESQLRGLFHIISKELAIVQGPPGTGKTFTSVEAIKVLVANRRRTRASPIIVAAQTNHALDQILIHCIAAGTKVLRVGSRTQNELVKERTIWELRQKTDIQAEQKVRSIDRELHANEARIRALVHKLFGEGLLNPDDLVEAGIISQEQKDSLQDDSYETEATLDERGPFALWLGDSLIPAEAIRDSHITQKEFDETDERARKELLGFECEEEDLENIGDADDEEWQLRGTWIPIQHVWSARAPDNLGSTRRAVEKALRDNQNLYEIKPKLRGAVYRYFQAKLLESKTPEFSRLLAERDALCKERKQWKFLGNVELVRNGKFDIIGCTTTGLTKYRGFLAATKPTIMLIEEAAETREANIVSALYPSIQQLILVGDHKQLAPKCDIIYLSEWPYNINVSLFQRMVDLNMHFEMLNQQRRMKPELRCIVNPFYETLRDHPSVLSPKNRPDVPGMGGRNCWWFTHNWPEDTNPDFSKFNNWEAEMIAKFFAYLVYNGTSPEKITILSFYKGQRKTLVKQLRNHPGLAGIPKFNVCTVDAYQGEENDIILLSIVRSPRDNRYCMGFVEDAHRAVVSISRARRGFYIFGNIENALHASTGSRELWGKIYEGFLDQGCADTGRGIPLVCEKHRREIWIKDIDDWVGNAGGCDLPCGEIRPCGHPCSLNCHPVSHNNLPCDKPCPKLLGCGHACQKMCSLPCHCDCENFKALAAQDQSVRHEISLEEKLLLMGAEPSEMLMTSLRERQAARRSCLPATGVNPPPGIKPAPTNTAVLPTVNWPSSRGNEANNQLNSYRDTTSLIATRAASTASRRVSFQTNMESDNKNETVAPTIARQPVDGSLFFNVSQRTTVQDGQRVNHGHRFAGSVQRGSNQRTTTRDDMAWSSVASSTSSPIHAGDFPPLASSAPQGTNKKGSASSKRSKTSKRSNGQGNTNQQQSATPTTATSSLLDEPLIPLSGSSSNGSVPAGLRGMSQLSLEPLIPSSRGITGDGNTNTNLSSTTQWKQPDEEEWLIDL